jgi:asparagine synthetase B (glutamine-hydrolysing)
MCGIAGSFGRSTRAPTDGLDAETRTILAHRGPDSFGSW